MRRLKTGGIIFGVVTIAAIVILAVLAVVIPADGSTATATSPAVTRRARVATQTPTTSPLPTSVKPTMTADQRAFIGNVYANVSFLEESLSQFSQLTQSASENPLLLADATWKGQIAPVLAGWERMYNAAKDGTAPDDLGIINGKWIETLGHFNLAADHYAHAIDQLSTTLLDSATAEFAQATSSLQQLVPMIDAYYAQHG